MNHPSGSISSLVIDGTLLKLPVTSGNSTSPKGIVFEKPSWMPDAEATSCLSCDLKFTHFRRKHHCRNCGKIFCSKCCSEKIPLPHFGMTEPEKVCNSCNLIVELMVKSRSVDMSEKYEAVVGLAGLLKNAAGLYKVIECGGVHVMLSLADDGDDKLKCAVASALHNITQTMVLNQFLVDAGCLKVIKSFLATSNSCELLNDSLSALNLLCMDNNIRVQVLKEGIIDTLLSTINSSSGVSSVFACRVLQLLVCNFEFHDFIIQNHPKIVEELFDAMENEDYQLQGCISKMLMHLSAGSTCLREMIIKEDVTRNFPLLCLLKGTSQGVLINVTCIIANLAISITRNHAHHYISGMCELLTFVSIDNKELLTQLGRGLANFAEFPANALIIVQSLDIIISNLLKASFEEPRFHACRLLVYLLSKELPCALDILSQSGLNEFITTVFELPGIPDILNNLFLRKVSRLSICKQ